MQRCVCLAETIVGLLCIFQLFRGIVCVVIYIGNISIYQTAIKIILCVKSVFFGLQK